MRKKDFRECLTKVFFIYLSSFFRLLMKAMLITIKNNNTIMFNPVKISITILEKSEPAFEKMLLSKIGNITATSIKIENAKTAMLVFRLINIDETINGV